MKKKSFRKKLSRKIRHKLRAIIFPDHVHDHHLGIYPFDLEQLPNLKLKSFGDKNPDKNFLVIWRDNIGSGFFANLHTFLLHLDFARNFNFIPIIDCENFPTIYNIDQKINNSKNSWQYYFHQPSPYSLEEVYQSKNVFFSTGLHLNSHACFNSRSTYKSKSFRQIITDEILLQSNVIEQINKFDDLFHLNQSSSNSHSIQINNLNNIINDKQQLNNINFFQQVKLDINNKTSLLKNKVLGVHLRGKDMNSTQLHPFGPTLDQIFRYTDQMLEKYSIDKIFLACEDLNNFEEFINRYPKITHYIDSYRTAKINAFNISPRENHRYLLGLEVLVEAILLGKCSHLLRGPSNVAEFAKTIGNHKAIYYIDNGMNSKKRYLARIKYPIQKNLPKIFLDLKIT